MRIELRNLNLLFNKEYYRKLGTEDFNRDVVLHNKDILSATFRPDDYRISPIASHTLLFETCYPGLLSGTGNPHGVGKAVRESKGNEDDADEDVSLGFSFDYVTGQPYIPGSSVKGVLRSHFKYYEGRINAVEEILRADYPEIAQKVVGDLEKAIFDNADVFLNAVIFDGNEYGSVMGFDYITPHSSQTSNPNPIRIVKVLPGVRFQFRFKLSDKDVDGMHFSADRLLQLFEILLTQFGAGAKTNVGYGIFSPLPYDTLHREPKPYTETRRSSAATPKAASANGKRIECPFCHKMINRINPRNNKPNTYCYICKMSLKG